MTRIAAPCDEPLEHLGGHAQSAPDAHVLKSLHELVRRRAAEAQAPGHVLDPEQRGRLYILDLEQRGRLQLFRLARQRLWRRSNVVRFVFRLQSAFPKTLPQSV